MALELNNLNVLLGAFLFFSPWILAYAGDHLPTWNAWASGALVSVIALAALFRLERWEEWLNVLIGWWISIAPWVLGFADHPRAAVIHVIVGMTVAVVAGVELWRLHGRHADRPLNE